LDLIVGEPDNSPSFGAEGSRRPATPERSMQGSRPFAPAIAPASACALAGTAFAQPSNDELAARVTDPTTSLLSFQLRDWYQTRVRHGDNTANQIVFRATISWDGFGHPNIFRITLPVFTHSPSGRMGLSDTTVFDLTVFNVAWRRRAIGANATLPTARDGRQLGRWTAGPASGFVNSSEKRCNRGLFAPTFFSFAGDRNPPDVGMVNVQPIFSYQPGESRSTSLGNSALACATERSRWTTVMPGASHGQIVARAGHK
jgi:hypothetical protein